MDRKCLSFCSEQLKKNHPRDDYKELLELTVVYLCGNFEKRFSFRKPGALHRARWMARIIYSLKIVLFRSQFNMKEQEAAAMTRFANFAVRFYVPNWFSAPSAASAPRNDLKYLQELECCDDYELSVVASKALKRHLWYLGEELAALAFMYDA